MFAVLQPEPYRRRFVERLRAEKPIDVVRTPVPGGVSFFTLHVPHCGAVGWPRVAEAAGRLPLLLPRKMQAPECVRLFTPRRLPLVCAAQTAASLLRDAKRPARENRLGVLDPDGALRGSAAALLSAAGDVRIVSSRPARFDADVRLAMAQWGAALTVSDDPHLLEGCTALVCLSTVSLPPCMQAETVFCLENGCGLSGAVVLADLRLPPPYAQLLPGGVDPLLFASALYELCAVSTMEKCRFIRSKLSYDYKLE